LKTSKLGKVKKKRSKNPTKGLIKRLDAIFSTYIRLKYSKNGMVECYTCGDIKPIKEMQNGHFVTRASKSTRWIEKNCRPQCYGCNIRNEGRKDIFAVKLEKDCGQGILQELNDLKNQVFKVTPEWYKEQIEIYKKKVEEYE
jgi:hypothetical protein